MVITLARSLSARVLIDDKKGRIVAQGLGVEYLGAAGVLLWARFEHLITAVEFETDLFSLSNILWLSPSVVATLLKTSRDIP